MIQQPSSTGGPPPVEDVARGILEEAMVGALPSTCGFCHGQPVTDAASWQDGKPRPPAACPRCGRVSKAAA